MDEVTTISRHGTWDMISNQTIPDSEAGVHKHASHAESTIVRIPDIPPSRAVEYVGGSKYPPYPQASLGSPSRVNTNDHESSV